MFGLRSTDLKRTRATPSADTAAKPVADPGSGSKEPITEPQSPAPTAGMNGPVSSRSPVRSPYQAPSGTPGPMLQMQTVDCTRHSNRPRWLQTTARRWRFERGRCVGTTTQYGFANRFCSTRFSRCRAQLDAVSHPYTDVKRVTHAADNGVA